jgi:catechol 2,3-dioxygenase-like lactoylglutathione lyase family enzyme
VADVGGQSQKLDHIGLIVDQPDDVDEWYRYLLAHSVKMANAPKTHRDGARSFYCYDPEDNVIQIIFHPPISAG